MVRILATFPELVVQPPATGPERASTVRPAGLPGRDPGDAATVPPTERPRPRPARARFPRASVLALGVGAAVIWALVAVRERATAGPRPAAARLAAEPAGSATPEASR